MRVIPIRAILQRAWAWVKEAAEVGLITATGWSGPAARRVAGKDRPRRNTFQTREIRPGYKRLMGRLTGGTDTVTIVSEDRGC